MYVPTYQSQSTEYQRSEKIFKNILNRLTIVILCVTVEGKRWWNPVFKVVTKSACHLNCLSIKNYL